MRIIIEENRLAMGADVGRSQDSWGTGVVTMYSKAFGPVSFRALFGGYSIRGPATWHPYIGSSMYLTCIDD